MTITPITVMAAATMAFAAGLLAGSTVTLKTMQRIADDLYEESMLTWQNVIHRMKGEELEEP